MVQSKGSVSITKRQPTEGRTKGGGQNGLSGCSTYFCYKIDHTYNGMIKMDETQVWKKVTYEGFGRYMISNKGQIYSTITNKILKQHIRNGYPAVCLTKVDGSTKTINIHQIMAETFILKPIINEKLVINHRDGNKTNNNATNLEWMTYSGNRISALENNQTKVYTRRVAQYDLNNNLLATFESIREASIKTGVPEKQIPRVCKGNRKTTYGYIWKYVDQGNDDPNGYGKPVPGFENYLVTNDGRIYSKMMKKWLKMRQHPSGYMAVNLCNNNFQKPFYVHQLVAQLYIPNPNNKKFVNHKNGIKNDNNVTNLEWVTGNENMIHVNMVLKNKSNKNIC